MRLAPLAERGAAPLSVPVALPHGLAVASRDGKPSAEGFDAEGRSLAAQKVPERISYAGVTFALAPATSGAPNAVVARGQEIALPPGRFTRVHLLAASAAGDQKATFRVGGKKTELTIQDWGGFIGQWDNRRWSGPLHQGPPGYDRPDAPPPSFPEYLGLTPGFVKPAPVAWFASHRHDAEGGNQPYAYSHLFACALDVPEAATSLALPDNDRIRVLAMTLTDEGATVRPATPLCDMLGRSAPLAGR